MTTWDDIENGRVDTFNRQAAPTRNPWDNTPVGDWHELFVMVHRSAIRLHPQRFHALCKAKRLMDNHTQDICKRPEVLEEVLGYKRATLAQLLTPDSKYTARREHLVGAPMLSDYLRLRTTFKVTGDDQGYEDLDVSEVAAHVWYSATDGQVRWRLDVEPIRFETVTDAKGVRKKVIASPDDAFVRIPYHWMYEHPDTTGGDTWIEKRYTATVKDRKTGTLVETDVTARALRAAAVVAACATHDFKRGQRYGIAGLAKVAGVSPSTMAEDLAYAEDAGLIGVANRKGRHKALRWVRLHPDDRQSPEGREKRSHGPTKGHNADVMEQRRLAREAQAALDAQQAVEEAEFEAATEEWLRGLPAEAAMPALAYAVGDDLAL